jgi:phenylalanyl-tRNA synthetase beta chain
MQCEPLESDLFEEAVAYKLRGKELLQIGAVSPAILRGLDIKAPVWFLEMDFGHLFKSAAAVKTRAIELSKFPAVRRDLALLVDKSVTFRRLRDEAFAAEKRLLKNVALFDVYEGDKLPGGKKSYALALTLEDPAATLTDQAIDRAMGNLIARFEKQTGATVRS